MSDAWVAFFTATAGAGGALVGLIIVAMATNISRILSIPGMTSRAGATIASLVLLLVTSVAALIPDQGAALLGSEILLFGCAAMGFSVDSGVHMVRHGRVGRSHGTAVVKMLFGLVQLVPFIVGGLLLASGSYAGLHWCAAGMLLVFIGSVVNAWVLLVEILR